MECGNMEYFREMSFFSSPSLPALYRLLFETFFPPALGFPKFKRRYLSDGKNDDGKNDDGKNDGWKK